MTNFFSFGFCVTETNNIHIRNIFQNNLKNQYRPIIEETVSVLIYIYTPINNDMFNTARFRRQIKRSLYRAIIMSNSSVTFHSIIFTTYRCFRKYNNYFCLQFFQISCMLVNLQMLFYNYFSTISLTFHTNTIYL